jgi:hypothetical protein
MPAVRNTGRFVTGGVARPAQRDQVLQPVVLRVQVDVVDMQALPVPRACGVVRDTTVDAAPLVPFERLAAEPAPAPVHAPRAGHERPVGLKAGFAPAFARKGVLSASLSLDSEAWPHRHFWILGAENDKSPVALSGSDGAQCRDL